MVNNWLRASVTQTTSSGPSSRRNVKVQVDIVTAMDSAVIAPATSTITSISIVK